MTDKIIYTICSYEDEHSDIVNGCVNSSLVTIDRYARFCNADLKIIKDIPIDICDLINKISKKHNKTIKHEYKAWNTKYHIIHDFYNSPYNKMVYIDCDHFIKNYNINVFKNNNCFNIKRKTQKQDATVHDPIKLCRQYLNKDINTYFNASFFYLTKCYKHNLSKIDADIGLPFSKTFFSSKCQPLGLTIRVAVESFSLYVLSLFVYLDVL